MTYPTGEWGLDAPRLAFDRRLKLEIYGCSVTSDAELLAYCELDDALGLTTLAGAMPSDGRYGKNTRHFLTGLLRQSVFGRLAGYEDVNDADRLARDPAMRWIVGGHAVAKVEWHTGELYPRVGFVVTNMARPAERVVAFYNQRGTCQQWIKKGKNAMMCTRPSCCSFTANAVRLQLHALADNLGNFRRTLALPEAVKHWSLTSLPEKLVKIGAKIVTHARYVTIQMAEAAVPS